MADRRYETLVLIHAEQGEPGAKELAARIRSLIEDQSGTDRARCWSGDCASLRIPSASNAGRSTSCSSTASASAGSREVERNIRLMDPVLRFISVQSGGERAAGHLASTRPPEVEPTEGDEGAGEFESAEGEGA